jgi:hypothetical protein
MTKDWSRGTNPAPYFRRNSMHYLHKILVYIPDVSKEADSVIRDSL